MAQKRPVRMATERSGIEHERGRFRARARAGWGRGRGRDECGEGFLVTSGSVELDPPCGRRRSRTSGEHHLADLFLLPKDQRRIGVIENKGELDARLAPIDG